MPRKHYQPEEIIKLLRLVEIEVGRGKTTGHDQTAIKGALRECAPGIRQNVEQRDWNDYAQRTARYAYSAAGDRQAGELVKYRQTMGDAGTPRTDPTNQPSGGQL